MITVKKKEKEFYEGKEIKCLCYSCTEKYVTTVITATDKYSQNHQLQLCEDCKKELIKEMAKLES